MIITGLLFLVFLGLIIGSAVWFTKWKVVKDSNGNNATQDDCTPLKQSGGQCVVWDNLFKVCREAEMEIYKRACVLNFLQLNSPGALAVGAGGVFILMIIAGIFESRK
jgi:hypothetical protein